VRVFCLTNANLNFADQAAYGVYKDGIKKLWP
jgi:hypothetical protein